MNDWPIAKRTAYLEGGGIATNPPNSNVISIWPKTFCGKILTIKIPTYEKFYYALRKNGFSIVGVDFITHETEDIGISPPQWRVHSTNEKHWPGWDSTRLWSEIGNSAYHHEDSLCFELAKKISYQINATSERLREISIAYSDQVNSIMTEGTPNPTGRLHNGFTDIVYQKFHSFLYDSCILRDYLCEFLFTFSPNKKDSDKPITTASGLLKLLKNRENLSDAEQEAKLAMSDGGWLKELGNYRDFVMHMAPINLGSHQSYCIKQAKSLPESKQILSIRLPIPENPEETFRSLKDSKDIDFKKYKEKLLEIKIKSTQENGKYDCLQYAKDSFIRLCDLLGTVSKISPYQPMQQLFFLSGENATSTFIPSQDL